MLAQDANLQVGNIHALLPGGTLEAAAAELSAAAEQAPPTEPPRREGTEGGLAALHGAGGGGGGGGGGALEAAGASVAGAQEAGPAASAEAAAAVRGTPPPEGWLSLRDTAQVWAMVSADEPPPPLPPHPDAQPVPPATHELPPAVLHLAAQAESAHAAEHERQHAAATRDATLLRAAWPFGEAPPASSPPSLPASVRAGGATAAPVTTEAAAAAAHGAAAALWATAARGAAAALWALVAVMWGRLMVLSQVPAANPGPCSHGLSVERSVSEHIGQP